MNDHPDENRTRLVLLDDHCLFRASLARLLASEPGFEVVGEYGTSAEVLEILHGSAVDVVLLDLNLGTENTVDFMSAARGAGYPGRFLIVTGRTDAESSAFALKLGASGVFLKSDAPDRLVQAIRLIATGAVWIDQRIIQLLADECVNRPHGKMEQNCGRLEEREQRVLLGILGGLTNKKIGTGMGLSESSVKNILQGLFSKTGVRKRSQLVRLALEGSLGRVRRMLKQRSNESPMAARQH